ncbi:MAG: ABC transporter substrate-binding protein [Tissierella sp.]|nr:ABC transporter substrate-binding protein [Tissierella sp.]
MKRNLKKISLLFVMMLILVGLAACANEASDKGEDIVEPPVQEETTGDVEIADKFPLEIEDAFGNVVVIENAPERIISLAPSHTEILYALDLGDKVVGVTAFCDYPEEALAVEKIGDFNGTNLEKIIELEPDLIVSYGEVSDEENSMFESAGIPVIAYMPESMDEVIETINQIAKATDVVEEGNTLTNNMIQKRDEIVAKVQDSQAVKAFYEVWHEPLMAAGSGSFVDGLINLANGINIASDAEGAYPNYDVEQLIENDPQVYLTANMDSPDITVETISARPGYDNITAVKNGDIYLLDGNIISRPGPRIVEGLELIARALHPEAFE